MSKKKAVRGWSVRKWLRRVDQCGALATISAYISADKFKDGPAKGLMRGVGAGVTITDGNVVLSHQSGSHVGIDKGDAEPRDFVLMLRLIAGILTEVADRYEAAVERLREDDDKWFEVHEKQAKKIPAEDCEAGLPTAGSVPSRAALSAVRAALR